MAMTWTPIAKGERKPPGYVLVTCTYETSKFELAMFGGQIKTFYRIRIGRWNKTSQRWHDDGPRGEKLNNVTAWMPLPPPYEATP
jgi:hypothetical protein